MGFRKFHKEAGTVEIPFDRYEELVLVEQRYEQTVRLLQDMSYKGNNYICVSDINRILEFLGEDVFTGKGQEEHA